MSEEHKIEWWKLLPSTVGVALGLLVAAYFGYLWLTISDNSKSIALINKEITITSPKVDDLSNNALLLVQRGTCGVEKDSLMSQGGKNPRVSRCDIKFDPPFTSTPAVMSAITEINTGSEGIKGGLRLNVSVTDESRSGATVTFRTWHVTEIASASASWIAIGR